MKDELKKIVAQCLKEVEKADKEAELLNIKAKYLGKKSKLNEYLSKLKDMTIEDKKVYGRLLNKLKNELDENINEKLQKLNDKIEISFDETLPVEKTLGSLHPITIVSKELCDILKRMGFTIVTGPEMETEFYNFEALNVSKNHPARDMHDTYWLTNDQVLRTHTSNSQIHAMENYGAPIRVVSPGRTFRNESLDASHENTFFQFEGMVIDKDISIGNLLYVVREMLKAIFKKDINVRTRPGFFPFTEPSFEIDCTCQICEGKGCPTCKFSGWIELCPGGMIHPNVLKAGGIDPNEYNGFAFGLGLTRLAMMKYKINDIRILNSGDLRYLNQWNIE